MNLTTPLVSLILSSSLFAASFVGTSNRSGEVEPCGCQVNQIGGLNRMAEWVQSEKKQNETYVLDAGDTFFSAPVISESRRQMELQRARLIADAYKEMGVTAFTPGERDLSFGIQTMLDLSRRAGIKVIVSNLDGTIEGIPPELIIESKNEKIGIIGLVSEEVFGGEKSIGNPFEALEEKVKEFKKKKIDKTIVLSHLGLNEDRKIAAKFPEVIIFGSHSLDPIAEGNILQPKHEGQQLTVYRNGAGSLVDLSKDWDKENTVAKMVRHYHEIRGIETAKEKEKLVVATSKKPYVANPLLCKSCHEEQYKFWESTKHSSSILVLYAKKEHLNSDCVTCHSLGMDKPGGFSSSKKAILFKDKKSTQEKFLADVFAEDKEGSLDSRLDPDRYVKLHTKYHGKIEENHKKGNLKKVYWGTQCEHCHGNRNGHPATAVTQKKVVASTCVQCHKPPNAPEFDVAMISKVACPLMKRE